MTTDEMAQSAGFANEAELHRMVSSVDLTKPGAMPRFMLWRDEDGTKEGLERLIQQINT